MADAGSAIELSLDDIREVAGYAAACAGEALAIFERARPDDARPRHAIEAARTFADGGDRTKAIRDAVWAAMRAAGDARDAGEPAAAEAARAAPLLDEVDRLARPIPSADSFRGAAQ